MSRKRLPKNRGLPPYLYIKKGRYVYVDYDPISRKQKEVSLGSVDNEINSIFDLYKELRKSNKNIPKNWTNRIISNSKKNAKARGIDYDIEKEDIEYLMDRCGGRCELTGIQFSFEKIDGVRVRPWIPSLDRIDSSKGYSLENCRLISCAANYALNEFGEEILLRIAKHYYLKRRQNAAYFGNYPKMTE